MEKWIIGKTEFEADEINGQLAVSPWSGHRQFAYDLVKYMRPQRIAELGTHYGCSFFSFLQACKDCDLDTEVTAIDCWSGDEQAGFYGEEVIETVKKTIGAKFSRQNARLIRKYFRDAAREIPDQSVDLLHIDGLHTYEAVSEDFAVWLPKLKKDGVILFHDVASKLGYGTNRFWKELQSRYDAHFTFEHSWGLGVLFPKGKKWHDAMSENNFEDKAVIYEYYAQNLLLNIQLRDHVLMVEERDKSMASMTQMIDDKDACIGSMTRMIDDRDACIASMTQMIDERDAYIKKLEKTVNENAGATNEDKNKRRL